MKCFIKNSIPFLYKCLKALLIFFSLGASCCIAFLCFLFSVYAESSGKSAVLVFVKDEFHSKCFFPEDFVFALAGFLTLVQGEHSNEVSQFLLAGSNNSNLGYTSQSQPGCVG